MEKTVLELCAIMFISQMLFIWLRTLNIREIAEGHIWRSILSGFGVHILWIITTSIGVTSLVEIVTNLSLEYLPVIACSSIAGGIGIYLGMVKKIQAKK